MLTLWWGRMEQALKHEAYCKSWCDAYTALAPNSGYAFQRVFFVGISHIGHRGGGAWCRIQEYTTATGAPFIIVHCLKYR